MFEENRMTGKTTRLVLQVANAISSGKSVLVVAHNPMMAKQIADRAVEVLDSLCGKHIARRQGTILEFRYGGRAQVLSRSSICTLRGTSYDKFYADVELTIDELMQILPTIRDQGVVDIDITSFETEYEALFGNFNDLNIQIFGSPEAVNPEDETPLEPKDACRKLSSR